jgi:serine phosphatase RsbU (regulator of sigma subunit)
MFRNRSVSIRTGLLASLLLVILLLSGGILLATIIGSRQVVRTLSRSLLDQRLDEMEARLRGFFEPPARVIRMARAWGNAGRLDLDQPDALRRALEPVLRQYPQITSLMVADDRGREFMLLRVGDRWINRLSRADEWGPRSRVLEWREERPEPVAEWKELDYDPRRRPWFQQAVARRGELSWTRPYTFFTTRDPGITASITFDAGEGRVGVIGFDVMLNDISNFTRSLFVSANGEVCVLTDEGKVIGLPQNRRFEDPEARQQAILQPPERLGVPVVADAVHAAPAEATRRPWEFQSGGASWLGQTRRHRLAPDRWLRIAVLVPTSDLLGEVEMLRAWIVGITLVVLALAVVQAILLARRFSRPIEALVRGSDRISRGDLEEGEPVASRVKEVQRLASAQAQMRASLRTLLKLERDMQLARQIQQDTWPTRLPQLEGFDLAASSQPADETGGDTYDVIGLTADGIVTNGRADRAVLLLADATGHGIGPALSVTQVRAMLRMALRTGSDLRTTARHLNEQLYEDLDPMRFVTAWLAVLDVADRTLTNFSAGQGPLLHYVAARDAWESLKPSCPPLGVLADVADAVPGSLSLAPGDLFVVASDGFFEAKDPTREEFGTERVQAVLAEHRARPAAEMLTTLRAAVDAFTEGAPPADDCTAVIVKATGG